MSEEEIIVCADEPEPRYCRVCRHLDCPVMDQPVDVEGHYRREEDPEFEFTE